MRSPKKLLCICGITVVLTPFLRVLAVHTFSPWMLAEAVTYSATPFRIDALLLGAAIALFLRLQSLRTQSIRPLLLPARITAATATIVSLAYLSLTWRPSHPYIYPTWNYTWAITFIDLFAASLVVLSLHPGTLVHALLKHPNLRWIGKISYGAYIFHDLLHTGYAHLTHLLARHIHLSLAAQQLLTAGIALPTTLALAYLSFRFFETPFLNLKERLAPPISSPTQPVNLTPGPDTTPIPHPNHHTPHAPDHDR